MTADQLADIEGEPKPWLTAISGFRQVYDATIVPSDSHNREYLKYLAQVHREADERWQQVDVNSAELSSTSPSLRSVQVAGGH